VVGHSSLTQDELGRDFSVGAALGRQTEDFQFPPRQSAWQLRAAIRQNSPTTPPSRKMGAIRPGRN